VSWTGPLDCRSSDTHYTTFEGPHILNYIYSTVWAENFHTIHVHCLLVIPNMFIEKGLKTNDNKLIS
jgi:hypothetical protein